MSFLPPVILEIRAQAAQFYAETAKVAEAVKAMAAETDVAAAGMADKVGESAAQMGSRVVSAAEVMGAKTAEEAEAMARAVIAEADQMDAGASAAAEDMARKIAASFAAMEAKTTASMEAQTARTTAQMEAQAARAAAAQEVMANKIAESAARAAAAEARAAKAAADTATETEVSGIRMRESFTKTAVSAAANMGTITGAFAGLAAEQAGAAAKSEASLVGIANGISKVAVVGGLIVAAASVDMAAKFEKSTMLLVTAGGESEAALGSVREGLLKTSTATGTSAEQMSEGMYVMEKAGIRGAAGLSALKMAAEGAKDENVDLGIMTQGLTDLLLDYGTNTKDAAAVTRDSVKYTNELVAASGAAKTTMTDFAGSLSAVVPIASSAKISFAEVGGAIATMTQHGQTAQQSSQNLANLIQSLVRPNNLASAAMQQMGIDTVDLAQHLGDRGLSGSLKIVDDAIKSHMQDGLVFQGSMKDNKNAVNDLHTEITKMPPALQDLAKGLLTGTESQAGFQKAAKAAGGTAGAVADQFLSLYKTTYGMSDNFKSGKPAAETYAAALRDVLGNVTAMRAAQMLLMNDSREFTANIKAIGDAGAKTGDDIATWADMQKTLSVQMDESKQMVENLGIEIGTKLMPVAKDMLGGFTDVFHGFEEGNPVLLGAAGIIGGALLISTVNLTQKMVLMGIAGVKNVVQLGRDAVMMGANFVAGMGSAEAAASSFTGKAGTLGGVVGRMGPLLNGAAIGAGVLGAAMLSLKAAQDQWGTNDTAPKVDEVTKALQSLSDVDLAKSTDRMDNLFKQFDSGPLKAAPKNVNNLDDAIARVSHEDFSDTMNKIGDAISNAFGAGNTSAISQVEGRFSDMGTALAKLTNDGNIDQAAKAFDHLAMKFKEQGKNQQDALNMMPAYKQALIDQAHAVGVNLSDQELLEFAMGKVPDSMLKAMDSTKKYTDAAGNVKPITPELQKSLDDAGVSADGLATDLEKLLTGMEQAGLTTLSTRDAQFRFADAVQQADAKVKDLKDKLHGDLSSALDATGKDFNKTTDAGKEAENQFAAVTRAGFAQADALAKTGAGHEELQGVLTDTYNKMVETAHGFGMGKEDADALARSVLGIPAGHDIKTWMDDYARQEAGRLTGAVNGIPTQKTVTINISPVGERRFIDAALGIPLPPASIAIQPPPGGYTGGHVASLMHLGGPGAFTGGDVDSIMGLAGGGVIPGKPPTNPRFDNILAQVNGRPLRVRSGEFITNEPQTKRNMPWLKAMNDGLDLTAKLGPSPAAAMAKLSIAPPAPVQVPQLAYTNPATGTAASGARPAQGGGSVTAVTNNNSSTTTVTNQVTIHSTADAHALAGEFSRLTANMS